MRRTFECGGELIRQGRCLGMQKAFKPPLLIRIKNHSGLWHCFAVTLFKPPANQDQESLTSSGL